MIRRVVEAPQLDPLRDVTIAEPVRFVLPNPLRGGPRLSEVRTVLGSKGILRLSGTLGSIFADIDPGDPETPLIGLEMISRSDGKGLERAILSALPEVDEIVVGIDGRSDEETRRVAEAYADVAWSFAASDLGLSEEDWAKDKIDFSAARNASRSRLRAPWSLVVDTDEYIARTPDLRVVVRDAGKVGAYGFLVRVGDFEQRDPHRLAKTVYKWWSATHNQLAIMDNCAEVDGLIVHDTRLRTDLELDRREDQRRNGVDGMVEEAKGGNMSALYHLAKHKISEGDLEGVKLAEDYRLRAEPHGPLADERSWLAVGVAVLYYEQGNFPQAELWALRAMLDGPRIEALCLLGDVAEDCADVHRALAWYEAACSVPMPLHQKQTWRGLANLRWGRLAGIRRSLGHPIASSGVTMRALASTWRDAARLSASDRPAYEACAAELEALAARDLPSVGDSEPGQSGEAAEPESDAGAEAR